MMFYPACGFLKSNESIEITLVLTEHEIWLQDPSYYTGKIHKIIVENMFVNDLIISGNENVNYFSYFYKQFFRIRKSCVEKFTL